MRICFLGPATSAHIIKWSYWFKKQGYDVHVVSFLPNELQGIQVHYINSGADAKGGDIGKLKYLLTGGKIKKEIEKIRPDIISVHYATSYGIAVALSGVKGYYLSIWGSDVYDFPNKSPFHKVLLKYSLKRAKYMFSTSQAMAHEARKYTKKEIEITPFGVDMELFNPNKRNRKGGDWFIVGTVKSLYEKYGIKYILEAVSKIRNTSSIPIQLRIAGKGPEEKKYHELAKELGIDDITTWLGYVSQEKAALEWANMDVAIIPSTLESESFGVSAVEAQACGTPVIISDIPGLMEATKPNETSIVVKRNESEEISSAIIELYQNEEYRKRLGLNGVTYVREHYEMNTCFERILSIFEKTNKEK